MPRAKTATIDRVWSCVGSTNLDRRSFLHNGEIDAAILGREFAGQMQAAFTADLEASEAMDLKRLSRRRARQRPADSPLLMACRGDSQALAL